MRTFVLRDAKGDKFWSIDLRQRQMVIIAGAVGTRGKTKIEFVYDEKKAQAKYNKLVDTKAREGYVEVVEPPPAAPPADRLALEAGLAARPDEVTAHSAYADYLTEHDDPRGEFVQTQLALEDESLARPERAELATREKELQARYERQWLGTLGRFLVGDWCGPNKPYHFELRRGWLLRTSAICARSSSGSATTASGSATARWSIRSTPAPRSRWSSCWANGRGSRSCA